jgi:simple sugar transport system permease protein
MWKISLTALPLAVAFLAMSAIVYSVGRHPLTIFSGMIRNGVGSLLGLTQSVTLMIPLLLCALAVAIPARVGLFNIGGEGQFHIGAIAATAIALHVGTLPRIVVVPLMCATAALAGGMWSALPGWLRARLGVSEVLVGLMGNYIGILLVGYLVHGPWKDPSALGWPYSAAFPPSATLPTIGTTYIHIGLLFAIIIAAAALWVIRSTTWGFSSRLIQANPATARYAGVPLIQYVIAAMLVGGAVAGLAGLGEVSVVQGRLRPDMSPGFGYAGFLIAWLSRNNFAAIVPVAFAVSALYVGADALQLTAGLPSSTVDVVAGLVFFAVFLARTIAAPTWEGADA